MNRIVRDLRVRQKGATAIPVLFLGGESIELDLKDGVFQIDCTALQGLRQVMHEGALHVVPHHRALKQTLARPFHLVF